jgi:hypothetical protein
MARIKSSITRIYHVSVTVPEDVQDYIKGSDARIKEWERDTLQATRGNVSAGSNEYSELEEWAEFHSMDEAMLCESRLIHLIRAWRTGMAAQSTNS